jgi:hypothetical protein
MKELILPLTTVIATQAATTDATEAVLGKLYAIEYRPNTIDTNAHLTVTCLGVDGVSKALLFKEHPGTSNLWFYPREAMQAVLNGADLTATSGGDCAQPILEGIPRAVIASGGATTVRTGTVIIYWEML